MMTGSKMATYIKGLFKLVIKLISTTKLFISIAILIEKNPRGP